MATMFINVHPFSRDRGFLGGYSMIQDDRGRFRSYGIAPCLLPTSLRMLHRVDPGPRPRRIVWWNSPSVMWLRCRMRMHPFNSWQPLVRFQRERPNPDRFQHPIHSYSGKSMRLKDVLYFLVLIVLTRNDLPCDWVLGGM